MKALRNYIQYRKSISKAQNHSCVHESTAAVATACIGIPIRWSPIYKHKPRRAGDTAFKDFVLLFQEETKTSRANNLFSYLLSDQSDGPTQLIGESSEH